ncbi:MAG: hypothetical protein PHC34_09840 [Candidatus Gastranaerophilales bacterium]|nr:hypothetical protein [Candidatus Gastranaerophilales bacterium]
MEELVIFSNEFLLILIFISLMLVVFELIKHSGFVIVVSIFINSFVIVYSVLKGAQLKEIMILLLLFLIPHLQVFGKGRIEK